MIQRDGREQQLTTRVGALEQALRKGKTVSVGRQSVPGIGKAAGDAVLAWLALSSRAQFRFLNDLYCRNSATFCAL